MEIKVGAKFNKVGTEEIVTVTKYDATKGTVIIKFPNGRSIPLSTGSLMNESKWKCVDADEDETEETVVEEKPKKEKVKKEKKKPMAKKRKVKIVEQMGEILLDAVSKSNTWDEITFCNDKKENGAYTWEIAQNTADDRISFIGIKYCIKEKQLEVSFNDYIAELIKGTEFDKLDIMGDEFIEDKLKDFLNLVVEKANEKESEEKTDGTI